MTASNLGKTVNNQTPLIGVEQASLEILGFNSREDPDTTGEISGPLGASLPQASAIAFSCKDHGQDASEDLSPTLRSMGHGDSHANGGGQVAVAFALRGREEGAVPEVEGDGGVASTLRSASGGSSRDYVAFAQNTRDEVRFINGDGAIAGALAAEAGMKQQTYVAEVGAEDVQAWSIMPMNSGKDYKARQVEVAQPPLAAGPTTGAQGGDMVTHYSISAVRRLTPMECERLQGYRDGYTDIDWKGRPDSPRYKALGNSWAVPCVRWVGERIIKELDRVGEEGMAPGALWGADGPVEYRLAA